MGKKKRWWFDRGGDGWQRDTGLLLLRVGVAGSLIFAHGWGKLLHYSQAAEDFPDPLGIGPGLTMLLAIFAEVFCAAAVAVGLATRAAVLPLIATFVVAFFLVHGGDPFAEKELAFLYLIAFGAILFTGPGRYSLDHWLHRR